jgi:hypothetical protein
MMTVATTRFPVPEDCAGGERVAVIDYARALHVTPVRVTPDAPATARGETQGRQEGLRVRLRKGQVLRLADGGGDCPGVNVIAPSGALAYEGLLYKEPALVAIDEDGEWEIDLLGYAGAHGRNSYDLHLSLVGAIPRPTPADYLRWEGRYPHELRNDPGARADFLEQLGAAHDDFWGSAGVQSPMRLVDGRWLVGHGCIPERCPDGGGWFVVDGQTGRMTAATYTRAALAGAFDEVPVLGAYAALPDAVKAAVDEARR